MCSDGQERRALLGSVRRMPNERNQIVTRHNVTHFSHSSAVRLRGGMISLLEEPQRVWTHAPRRIERGRDWLNVDGMLVATNFSPHPATAALSVEGGTLEVQVSGFVTRVLAVH